MRLTMKAHRVSAGKTIHAAEVDGHYLMLGMPESRDGDSLDLDVMITGTAFTTWIDGTTQSVIKVEQVRTALKHTLCVHDGWVSGPTREAGLSAVFHMPDGGKATVHAGPRSRIIRLPRQVKMPGRAWLGFNPRSGTYLAGLESFSDVFMRKPPRDWKPTPIA